MHGFKFSYFFFLKTFFVSWSFFVSNRKNMVIIFSYLYFVGFSTIFFFNLYYRYQGWHWVSGVLSAFLYDPISPPRPNATPYDGINVFLIHIVKLLSVLFILWKSFFLLTFLIELVMFLRFVNISPLFLFCVSSLGLLIFFFLYFLICLLFSAIFSILVFTSVFNRFPSTLLVFHRLCLFFVVL